MMACVLALLVLSLLLIGPSASPPSSGDVSEGAEPASHCPPRWLLLGQRCFAFYPVWSSWSSAESMCSQTGGHLASLHTPEERLFVGQLVRTHTPVWLGGRRAQQNGSWVWTDDQNQEETGEGGACMQMDPISGELHGAPCGELWFYICSTAASSEALPENRTPVKSGLAPNVSLFDAVWGPSDALAEEILRWSCFFQELQSGRLKQRCYSSFMQQEALYLQRVSSMLEVLVSSLQEADAVRSLLLDTLEHYSSRTQNPINSPPPQWLQSSLQSFHFVVLEEPIYWLVALSARACLYDLLSGVQVRTGSGSELVYQDWSEESLKEVVWTQRYRQVLEKHQDQMDTFKAIHVFRQHMMNQKSLHKAVVCDDDIGDTL
ncbi:uncharacterized protein LOC115590265 isoform X2 [Sparus aurata]|uniref:uncharacterized protein LOC115590265 isoform X1 n=1 Tax=Sparus aurata TaxID=8175 RepID=UPI0011C141F7|nr:uncharacterized protein LOC115590265 isoform X1 [Sparus aurata]XP_030287420.1 uncharacterized protein LOC115590265 isoform X1 [Sparus aurata]XP_030287421.1 uncharacterized protein LOC115590265 isoform X2 [Sparus aurata]